MNGDFNKDLREKLKDPEFAAHFANAQAESARELLKCGVISSLTLSSFKGKVARMDWRVK